MSYLISPNYCHRFVGYLEEEAVHTYSVLLDQLSKEGRLPEWENMKAPKIATSYYELPEDSKLMDAILSIRADESIHRDINHRFADIVANSGNECVDCENEVERILEKDRRILKNEQSSVIQEL